MPTGYSLQTKRLLYSGGKATRSFKFPLVPFSQKSEAAYKDFIGEVRQDAVNMMGALQLFDWKQKGETYSLADFYLDSLRAGVIFAHKFDAMKSVVLALGGGKDPQAFFAEQLRAHHPDLADLVDMGAFYNFCTSNSRQRNKTKEELLKILAKSLFTKTSWKDQSDRVAIYVGQITEWVYDKTNAQKSDAAKEFLGFNPKPESNFDFTAVISLDLPFVPDMSAYNLVERIGAYIEGQAAYTQYKAEDRLSAVLGLYNKQGAFSNFFNEILSDLKKEKGHTWFTAMTQALPAWQKREPELRERITFLAERAKQLTAPALARGWHDYRTSLGGKIESWASNFVRQKDEIRKQLFGHETITERGHDKRKKIWRNGHKQTLENILEDDIVKKHSDAVALACAELKCIATMELHITDALLSLYSDQLGQLRIALNEAYQAEYPENLEKNGKERKQWESGHRANRKYAQIYDDIKLIPRFPGEAKYEKYRKLVLAPKLVKTAVAYLQQSSEMLRKQSCPEHADEECLQRMLETLRRKYFVLNGTIAAHMIRNALKPFACSVDGKPVTMDDVLNEKQRENNKDYWYFWRAKQARARFGRKIDMKYDKNVDAALTKIAVAIAPRWTDRIASGDIGDLLDACELEKIRMGILVDATVGDTWPLGLDTLPGEMFEKAHAFKEVIGDRPATRAEFGRFLQSCVLSELKGALNKMSRKEYTERYVVQPIASHEKYPLFNHEKQWGIALDKKTEGAIKISQKSKAKGFDDKAFIMEPQREERLLTIRTSKHHLQFLQKTLGGKDSWWHRKKMGIENGEYSFIAEVPMRLRWDFGAETLQIEEADKPRLFVSIPFTLTPEQKKEESHLAAGKRKRYMGIDVGEFGLAWTVLEMRGDAPHTVGHGFIYERLTRNIRNYVQTLKTRQMRGTFGMPSTKLERLRENAITSLRNQVHAIAMKYDTIPVYEAEISAFETGGNKVKAIYDSVKRADTGRGGIEAEKMEADLVWGKWNGKGNAGKQIGAYATSYLCTKCLHSLYDKTPEADRSAEKKTTRPSLDDERVRKMGLPETWKNQRGNSAVYVCKCGHVSDADMQASYWIALKRALRDKKYGEQTDDSNEKKTVEIDDLRAAHRENPTVITLQSDGSVHYAPSSAL